jgi:hypothetical protein
MGVIANFYQKAQKENVLTGIIISDLIAFIAYVIFPAGIIFFGDFQMVLGVVIGTYFALKNLKEGQTTLKYGMIVAIGGSLLTAFSMYFFDWTIYVIAAIPFPTIIIFSYILEALIIGLAIGVIEGLLIKTKPRKSLIEDGLDDAFFESLKTK